MRLLPRDREQLDRIEANQQEILDFLRGKVAIELEAICQAVDGQHAQGLAATPNGDGDGRLADQG